MIGQIIKRSKTTNAMDNIVSASMENIDAEYEALVAEFSLVTV
jgi:hypothetical protein